MTIVECARLDVGAGKVWCCISDSQSWCSNQQWISLRNACTTASKSRPTNTRLFTNLCLVVVKCCVLFASKLSLSRWDRTRCLSTS